MFFFQEEKSSSVAEFILNQEPVIVVTAIVIVLVTIWWIFMRPRFAASYSKHNITKQLVDLRKGTLLNGPTEIYPLWKSLLECWLSDKHTAVYLVTPFMDEERFVDVCQIILQYKSTANVAAMYVRELCQVRIPQNSHNISIYQKSTDPKQKTYSTASVDSVKDIILNKLKSKDRSFIEKNVFSKLINPKMRFHAKFMAGVRGGRADILMTSANFQASHFEYQNFENVCYLTMSESDFRRKFITPLLVTLPKPS